MLINFFVRIFGQVSINRSIRRLKISKFHSYMGIQIMGWAAVQLCEFSRDDDEPEMPLISVSCLAQAWSLLFKQGSFSE